MRKDKRLGAVIYFALLLWLNFIFIVHAFRLYPLETDYFSRYVLAMIFSIMILPLIPKVKLFDIIDIKRETRMFNRR